jgi:hypothetical protein
MERKEPPVLKMMGQSQLVELMAREFTVANGAALTSDDCLSTETERMRRMVNMSNLHPTLINPVKVDLGGFGSRRLKNRRTCEGSEVNE